MDWNKLKVTSTQLHWVTGWPIDECREIFKTNYLPNKVDLVAIKKYRQDMDIDVIREGFETGWFKLVDNREFMLNEPFKEGFLKRTPKINYLLGLLPDDQVQEIEANWRLKQELLNRQTKLA